MSPVVLPPVSTAYCSLSRAPPPVSVMYQPVGSAVLVVDPAVLLSVSKFSVTALPSVVRLMEPVPVSSTRGGLRTAGATCAVSVAAESKLRNETTANTVLRTALCMALPRETITTHHHTQPLAPGQVERLSLDWITVRPSNRRANLQ